MDIVPTPPAEPEGLTPAEVTLIRAAAIAYYEDLIGQAKERSQRDLVGVAGMKPGGREPVVVDDVEIATITRPKITRRIAGFNSPETLAWAQEHYPDEITVNFRIEMQPVEVEVVEMRSSFTGRFTVSPTGVIRGPGNEMDIPGLHLTPPAKSTPAVRPNHAAIHALWPDLDGIIDRITGITPPPTTIEEQS